MANLSGNVDLREAVHFFLVAKLALLNKVGFAGLLKLQFCT